MFNLPQKLWRETGKRVRLLTRPGRTDTPEVEEEHEHYPASPSIMSQTNGIHREQTPVDTAVVPQGRVISNSMMRQGTEQDLKRYAEV